MEGGYNLDVIPLCMEAVVMAIRGLSWDNEGEGANPLAALSSPQPKAANRIPLSSDPLVRARLKLTKYWDFFESNPIHRGKKLSKGAISSINGVIKALTGAEKAFAKLGLRKVCDQIERRETGRRRKKKEDKSDELEGLFSNLKVASS